MLSFFTEFDKTQALKKKKRHGSHTQELHSVVEEIMYYTSLNSNVYFCGSTHASRQERHKVGGRDTGSKAGSADSRGPDTGLELPNHEITT